MDRSRNYQSEKIIRNSVSWQVKVWWHDFSPMEHENIIRLDVPPEDKAVLYPHPSVLGARSVIKTTLKIIDWCVWWDNTCQNLNSFTKLWEIKVKWVQEDFSDHFTIIQPYEWTLPMTPINRNHRYNQISNHFIHINNVSS